MLGLASCGGGSSDEAKELLSKILQFKGLPQNIVANICQDANRDGICGGGELFTKVTINKGDSIDDIWRKISLTKDGRYFLQTYNPELPILVELQDVAKVNYDDGKFTLAFNGFKTKEDDNETKEVSILESMVDADALSKAEADKFRTLTNTEAQDKYYTALLDSLEKNINTLRANELDKQTAMSATIKEMADEIKTNQEQADRINGCENNQTCVDEEIKKISDELIITDEEATEITGTPKATPTQTPTPTPTLTPTPTALSGAEEVYGKWVKPSQSVCENGGGKYGKYPDVNNDIEGNECYASWNNAKNICSASSGILPTIEELEQIVTDCGGIDADSNVNNSVYQACYQEKGFTSKDYRSSTVSTYDSSHAWSINFFLGVRSSSYKEYTHSYIRCVRGGQ